MKRWEWYWRDPSTRRNLELAAIVILIVTLGVLLGWATCPASNRIEQVQKAGSEL